MWPIAGEPCSLVSVVSGKMQWSLVASVGKCWLASGEPCTSHWSLGKESSPHFNVKYLRRGKCFCQKLAYENLVKHFCEDGLTSRCNDCILTLIGLNLCSILHKDVGIVQMKWAGH